VLTRLTVIQIDDRIVDIITNIAWFSDRVTNIEHDEIVHASTNTIKGKAGIDMAEVARKGIFQQGIECGRIKENVNDILKLL